MARLGSNWTTPELLHVTYEAIRDRVCSLNETDLTGSSRDSTSPALLITEASVATRSKGR